MDGDSLRARVRGAIADPVAEAEKLLAELDHAPIETTMPILLSGWGRGLAAGLEELARAIDQFGQPAAPAKAAPPHQPSRSDEPPRPASQEQRRELSGVGERELEEEARRSREETAEAARHVDLARREME
jgi:hypothetical protein